MTWDSHDPAAPRDPRQTGAPPPGRPPHPGYPPGPPPPPGAPRAGGPPGQPPPGYPPPPPGGWAPAPPPAYPPPGDVWRPPPAFPLAPDAYPVNVSFDRAAPIDRLWGLPVVGVFVRSILLIPHYILLFLVAIIASILLLFTWIPVLILGRFPGWGYRWIGGLFAWQVRVQAYLALLTPRYPPFALSSYDYPVSIRFDEGVRINRLWGIPFLGILVRSIILIPHFIILWLLGILVGVLLLVTWVPVLLLGRQADLIYTVVGGFTRWWFRVIAYLLLMVDRYPPFSLGEDDPHL